MVARVARGRWSVHRVAKRSPPNGPPGSCCVTRRLTRMWLTVAAGPSRKVLVGFPCRAASGRRGGECEHSHGGKAVGDLRVRLRELGEDPSDVAFAGGLAGF